MFEALAKTLSPACLLTLVTPRVKHFFEMKTPIVTKVVLYAHEDNQQQ